MSGRSTMWIVPQGNLFTLQESFQAAESKELSTSSVRFAGHDRKYAIRLLNGPAPQKPELTTAKGRRSTYGAKVIESLTAIWETARAIHARRGSKLSYRCGSPGPSSTWRFRHQVQKQLLLISPATIDRRLKAKKRPLTRAERQALLEISEFLGINVRVGTQKTTQRRVTS